MSETPDNPENLTLVYLRRILGEMTGVRADIKELRTRVGAVEHGIAQLNTTTAELSTRIDRLTDRIERIERRLDLVEEPSPPN